MEISEITLSFSELRDCLSNLDASRAAGPDGIPLCSEQIAPSLCDVFNHSLRSGRFPSEWKSTGVTPVH